MQNMTKDSWKTANELDILVQEGIKDVDLYPLLEHFELFGEGQKLEVFDKSDHQNRYYQWLASLMKIIKPKQVVELGSAAGISTTLMALHMPQDSKLYSVDIDPSIAWKWMKYDYPQVTKILGDDLNMGIWDTVINKEKLKDTDVWFIDALHTKEQLTKELELYRPYFKKGTIVVLDDIRMEGLWDVWQDIKDDKCENSNPCHHTGFGFFIT